MVCCSNVVFVSVAVEAVITLDEDDEERRKTACSTGKTRPRVSQLLEAISVALTTMELSKSKYSTKPAEYLQQIRYFAAVDDYITSI